MRGILLLFLLILSFGILTYKFSFALMGSSASSISNSFTAASEFSASPSVTPTPTATPGSSLRDVVINEIMWMGSSTYGSSDEWIELHNTTSSTIDISGWVVENLGGTPINTIISTGKTITPNGYFVIANNNEANSILNFITNDTKSISLANGGEQLVLKNGTTIIDIANISGAWFFGSNATIKASMQRKDPPVDGTVSANWKTATTQTNLDVGVTDLATPGGAN